MHLTLGSAAWRQIVVVVAGLAATASIGVWGALAAAAEDPAPAPTPTPKLEVLGDPGARTVELLACDAATDESAGSQGSPLGGACANKGDTPHLGGQVTLLVRNSSKENITLEVSYLSKGSTGTIPLPGDSDRFFLIEDGQQSTDLSAAAETVVESPPQLEPGESRPLSIGFALSPGEPAAAIDGSLIVGPEDEKPSVVPIAGAIRQFKGLSVVPSTLSMSSDDGDAEVTLVGPDLVEFLRFGRFDDPTATLYSDTGDTTNAALELPAADAVASSDHPNRAAATVTLEDANPPAGKYTGKLSLSDLATDAPSVDVELHSHRSFLTLVFLVLIGVIAGGLLTRLVTTAMRRRLLHEILEQSLDAYRHVLGTGETKSWRLDDLLGENPLEASPTPSEARLQGLQALRNSIDAARSSGDLDEDADRVLDMIARMQRWLRVEPLARRLAILAGRRPSASPTRLDWSKSKTLRDTRTLLEMAQREPADAAKADDLVNRLLFQIEWHNSLVAAWNVAANKATLTAPVKELEKALGDKSEVGARTAEDQDGLEARLQALVRQLPDGAVLAMPAVPGEPKKELKNGITPVKWNASSNLFTGWATLDAQSYGQLTRRAATSARAGYTLNPSDLLAELGRLRPPDIGWTIVALTVASIAYGAAEYSDTWGTCQDMATAFLAGVLGKAAVNWAALPIFQSIRLRSSKAEASS
jgi:hypothetical protein